MKKTKTTSMQGKMAINPYTKNMLLRHDKTEAEDRFTVEFILYLKRIGYSGEIHCRCFLANQYGEIRRPDFYLPRYGLAIEIDGITRHIWEHRQNDILIRDKFYESLGCLPPLLLDSTWVVSNFKMDRFKKEFSELLFKNRITPQRQKLVKKRLSVGRKKLEILRPEIFNSHGGLAPQFLSELAEAGFKEFRHFGGTRFVLRGKYETREIIRVKKLSKRFKSFLKDYFGKMEPIQVTKMSDFAFNLLDKNLERDERFKIIKEFSENNGFDFPKLTSVVEKLRAIY